ncbi:hypothetical protein J7M00_01480 [bacterium]|nr:hypothetical protein [bacterium]
MECGLRENYVLCFWLIFVFFSAIFGQPIDIADHPFPFADGFSDPAPEGLLPNPALLTSFPTGWASAEHERLFWGFGEPLQRSGLTADYNSCCTGIAILTSMLSAPIEYRWSAHLLFTRRLHKALTTTIAQKHWGFFIGAGIGIYNRGYNTSAMTLGQPDPLFSNGNSSKTAITASLGAAYRWKTLQLFAGAFNLTMPDMALGSEPDRIMPAFQVGGTYRIGTAFLWGVAQYSPRYGNIWLDTDPMVGVGYRMIKMLSFNGFATNHSAGIGASFIPQYDRGFVFTYKISYPLDGIKIPTHRFGIQFRLPPPEPLFPDIKPLGWKIRGNPISGEEIDVALAIKNVGNFRSPNVPVVVKIGDEDIRKFSLSPMLPDDVDTIEFSFTAEKSGDYKIYAFANRKEPSLRAKPDFIEKNPDDNEATTSVHIYSKPDAKLNVERGELHLLQLFSVAEDEPLVPLFFFKSQDDSLDERFLHTIDIIAKRLKKNPDVFLKISGYAVDGEDSAIALSRAEAVRRALISAQPQISDRLIISRNHDFFKKRAEKQKFQGTRLGKIYTAQENRRVELAAKIKGDKIDVGLDSLPLTESIERIKSILEKNPEVILAVRARDIPQALQYKKKLLGALGEKFSDKIFSQEGSSENISLVLSASGLIYRPPQVVQPREGYEIERGWDKVKLNISIESETPIKSEKIFIISDGDTIANFSSGSAIWDWHLPDGQIPAPGMEFEAIAVVEDTFGQVAKSAPQKLSVIVKNINQVKQRLILLQFAFAGNQSESEFTNARMEFVARRVIERIEAGNVDVVVAGHTDTIGTISGNEKLSRRRAEEQMTILKRYLRSLLGMDDNQLQQWIMEHNSTITAKGFGMSQPFVITRLRDGEEIPVMVGDNKLPEGRIKNRRVEILFLPKKGT